MAFPLGLLAPSLGFRGTSGKSGLAGDLAREIARFGRHKSPKRSFPALSKAHRRWYIPLAPRGFGPGRLLRKPPDGIGAPRVGQIRFGFSEKGAQRFIAGWSSPVARQAHNLKVIGSNPIPATKCQALENLSFSRAFCCSGVGRSGGSRLAAAAVAEHAADPWNVVARAPS